MRVSVYAALWLACFIPAEVRWRRGATVPPWLKCLIYISGLMLSATLVENFHR